MRITNNMMISNTVYNVGKNLQRMDKYQNQVDSGKKISVPSDDPVVAARALKLRTDVAEIGQHDRNITDATSWVDITDSALGNVTDILQRTRELTVQGSNGTNTPSDTQKIAEEVKQLRTQMISLTNSAYAGRYVFSGYQTNKPLVDTTTGNFNVSVELSEQIEFNIGVGDSLVVNATGGDVFNMGAASVGNTAGKASGTGLVVFPLTVTSTAPANNVLNIAVDGGAAVPATIADGVYNDGAALAGAIQSAVNTAVTPSSVAVVYNGGSFDIQSNSLGGTSQVVLSGGSAAADLGLSAPVSTSGTDPQTPAMIKMFDDLISALNAGDHVAVGSMIATVDDEMSNALRVRADLGARQNRLDLTQNRLGNDNINFTKLMSLNEDADMAEVYMNLKNEENVYKSSLAGGARIIQPTLMDFLR